MKHKQLKHQQLKRDAYHAYFFILLFSLFILVCWLEGDDFAAQQAAHDSKRALCAERYCWNSPRTDRR